LVSSERSLEIDLGLAATADRPLLTDMPFAHGAADLARFLFPGLSRKIPFELPYTEILVRRIGCQSCATIQVH
jgi:hypothetical protein